MGPPFRRLPCYDAFFSIPTPLPAAGSIPHTLPPLPLAPAAVLRRIVTTSAIVRDEDYMIDDEEIV